MYKRQGVYDLAARFNAGKTAGDLRKVLAPHVLLLKRKGAVVGRNGLHLAAAQRLPKMCIRDSDDGVNDRACLIRNKGEKQGKLGQKKGEDKSEQQEVARKRFILHDRPQQRDQQIQPDDRCV